MTTTYTGCDTDRDLETYTLVARRQPSIQPHPNPILREELIVEVYGSLTRAFSRREELHQSYYDVLVMTTYEATHISDKLHII